MLMDFEDINDLLDVWFIPKPVANVNLLMQLHGVSRWKAELWNAYDKKKVK